MCEQLLDQEEQAETLLKEINLMSSITGPQALEELTNHSKRLKDSIAETRELIRQKKDQGEKSFLQTIKGLRNCILLCVIAKIKQVEKVILCFEHFSHWFSAEEFQSFEEWLQDEQLSVNECFENPERKQDIETSMQRLTVSNSEVPTLWLWFPLWLRTFWKYFLDKKTCCLIHWLQGQQFSGKSYQVIAALVKSIIIELQEGFKLSSSVRVFFRVSWPLRKENSVWLSWRRGLSKVDRQSSLLRLKLCSPHGIRNRKENWPHSGLTARDAINS